jgi:hypothetical protein
MITLNTYLSDTIVYAANQYLTVLNNIGKQQDASDPCEITKLCDHNCKKTRNGKVLFETRESFSDQLMAAKDWLGTWSIQAIELLPIPDLRSAVIRYELTTEKEGSLLVFVILRFDEHHLIYDINEVHNKKEVDES